MRCFQVAGLFYRTKKDVSWVKLIAETGNTYISAKKEDLQTQRSSRMQSSSIDKHSLFFAMNDIKSSPSDYIEHFDALAYLKEYRNSLSGNESEGDFFPWMMTRLHEVFAQGNIKAERMLDVGTGPSIHSIISAAPHCDNIFLSDVVPQCREVLHQWLNNILPHSFQSFFKFVVDKEGNGESTEERERQLRKKVAGILPIDVLKQEPLAPVLCPKFQLITSSLCLESASIDVPAYTNAAQNVIGLLEEGGHIVLVSILKAVIYNVGKSTFKGCFMTGEEIKNVWKSLGCELIDYKEHLQDLYINGEFFMGGYCILVLRKKRS